jgi:hypothetical protein
MVEFWIYFEKEATEYSDSLDVACEGSRSIKNGSKFCSDNLEE